MNHFTTNNFVTLLIELGLILILSRVGCEISKKIKIPLVIGEIFLGIILGPTILGFFQPDIFGVLFPQTGGAKIAFDGIVSFSAVLFLFYSGLEVNLSKIKDQKRSVLYISISSMIIPMLIGFATVWFFPLLFDITDSNIKLIYALFLGTALSITALPVIIRILMELNLYKTKIGMIMTSSAIIIDITTWIIFSLIVSLFKNSDTSFSLFFVFISIMSFIGLMFYIGVNLIDKFLAFLKNNYPSVGNTLAMSMGLCLFSAAFTEYIGTHAVLGAFIMGIAFGESEHFDEKTRDVLSEFTENIFAPIFFVSIGLSINFIKSFDFYLILIILILAFLSKIIGTYIGAKFSGLTKNESLATAFGMNARGTMEIMLCTIALNIKLIDERMFVSLVIMALITTLCCAPLIKRCFLVNEK